MFFTKLLICQQKSFSALFYRKVVRTKELQIFKYNRIVVVYISNLVSLCQQKFNFSLDPFTEKKQNFQRYKERKEVLVLEQLSGNNTIDSFIDPISSKEIKSQLMKV